MNKNFKLVIRNLSYTPNDDNSITCNIEYELIANDAMVSLCESFERTSGRDISFGEVSATAYLKAGDKYSTVIGKNVARAKAENKMYLQATKFIDKVYGYIAHNIMGALPDFYMKADRVMDENDKYLSQF